MHPLSQETIASLLQPYMGSAVSEAPSDLFAKLSAYLDLLVKWNARTNLTAIRDPEEMVRRHFGESLFAARHLDANTATLLDFGSGAGFPGLPIALFHARMQVTLAESQNKKATFLREVVRTLGLTVEVHAGRVEQLPTARRFDTVTLRAVDNMAEALRVAEPRATGHLVLLTTTGQPAPVLPAFALAAPIFMPASSNQCLLIASRIR